MNIDKQCCDEFAQAVGMSRRRFLQGMAAAGAGAVATTVFGDALRQTAFGATNGNVLVVISLRGGIDGLGMVVPHSDPAYYAARPTIALPRESLIARDPDFGLHPQMKPLQWLWDSGELAAVHAVGMAQPNRSHFLAMEEIEDADPASSQRRGWINRMIGLDTGGSPTEAVHFTSSIMPTILTGSAPTLATGRLSEVELAGTDSPNPEWNRRRTAQLSTVWGPARGPLATAGRSALGTVRQLGRLPDTTYRPANGVSYPREWPAVDLSDALMDTAQLIRAHVGTEVVSIDYGSWDMHSDYGTVAYGEMQNMVRGFASALDAFMRDLGSLRSRVTVVTISEFGRRVAENGNRGLDHGWGNMMLLAGGGVKGGRYHGVWPGLGAGKLLDGDLQVTTDYRNVFGEVIHRRFPGRSVSKVFPGLAYDPLGVMA